MSFLFITLNKKQFFLSPKAFCYKYEHYHSSSFYTTLHSYDTCRCVGTHIQFVVDNWIAYNIPFLFSSTLERETYTGRRWKCITSKCMPWRFGSSCIQPNASGNHYNGLASHRDTRFPHNDSLEFGYNFKQVFVYGPLLSHSVYKTISIKIWFIFCNMINVANM